MSLVDKAKEIYSGWKNYLNRKITIEEMASVRQEICRSNTCGLYKTTPRRCSSCGCPEGKKIRSLISACPVDLWGYAYELKLQLTDQLLRDLSGMKRVVNNDGTILFIKKEIIIIFDANSMEAWYENIPDKRTKYWNELWSIYQEATGKTLY